MERIATPVADFPRRVIVLMGGPSGEHGVSLDSGRQVLEHLDPAKYLVKPVTISLDGHWYVPHGYLPPRDALALLGESGQPEDAVVVADARAIVSDGKDRPDVVFIAMHGPFGEDGTIQGVLEVAGLPYTGSGVAASSLAMDKPRAQALCQAHGLRTPPALVVRETEWRADADGWRAQAAGLIGYPAVCKPAGMGSSVALTMLTDGAGLDAALEAVFAVDPVAMLEPRVPGRELTCGVLADAQGAPVPLPVTEIKPKLADHFDYASKYTPGGSDEITPADLDAATTARVQAAAVRAHQVLGCEGMSRTDFMLDGETLWLLETNTIPGLTGTSLLPQEAAAAGITFGAMLDGLLDDALRRHQSRKRPQP